MGQGEVEGPSRADPSCRDGRTRCKETVNIGGSAEVGDLVGVQIKGSTTATLRGRVDSAVTA